MASNRRNHGPRTAECRTARAILGGYKGKDVTELSLGDFEQLRFAKTHAEDCRSCKEAASATPKPSEEQGEKEESKPKGEGGNVVSKAAPFLVAFADGLCFGAISRKSKKQ